MGSGVCREAVGGALASTLEDCQISGRHSLQSEEYSLRIYTHDHTHLSRGMRAKLLGDTYRGHLAFVPLQRSLTTTRTYAPLLWLALPEPRGRRHSSAVRVYHPMADRLHGRYETRGIGFGLENHRIGVAQTECPPIAALRRHRGERNFVRK